MIIGTALGAIGTGFLGNWFGGRGSQGMTQSGVTDADLWTERKQCENYLDLTRQYYEGKAATTSELTELFFDAYKRDIDNTWTLYKNQRDEDDAIRVQMLAGFTQASNERNDLEKKIWEVEKKVDVMSAIRPYQDALIDCKINNNALIGAYELQKRTCKMIQGELVLPSSNSITGYPSYPYCNCGTTTSAS